MCLAHVRLGSGDETLHKTHGIRAHAKAHTDKAAKLEYASLTERLCTDAFYAFNCAAQDMAPDCLKFFQRLSTAVLPIPTRTAQQIQDGVGVNVKAKILMTLAGHSYGTLLWDTLVGHSCRTLL